MILSFADQLTADLFAGLVNKNTRGFDPKVRKQLAKKFGQLNTAAGPLDLVNPPGNQLEKHEGRGGLWSIRVNNQWRLMFHFAPGGVSDVRVEDYH